MTPTRLALVLGGGFLGAALCTALCVPLVIRLARTQGWLDRPGGRRVHSVPIPRAGGLAVFLGLLLGSLCFAGLAGWDKLLTASTAKDLRGFLGPCLLVFLVGLLDDIRGTSPYLRLLVEAIAAATLIQAGYVIDLVATPWGPLDLGPFAFPLTLLWVVGITNAYNLIDGLDGLLATAGMAALGGCAAVGLSRGMVGTPALALVLAGALAGFLPFNWHPARVFLGDSGSLLIGFTVAAWSLKISGNPNQTTALHTMVLLSGLPIVETGLTLARRYVSGQRFFEGDQSHIHHVLLKKGLGVPKTVGWLCLVSVGFASAAYFARNWRAPGAVVTVATLVALGALFLRYLRYLEFQLIYDRFVQALKKPRRGLPGVLELARTGDEIAAAASPAELAAALAEAPQRCGLDWLTYEPTPRARQALGVEGRCEPANAPSERIAAELGEDILWLFSRPREPDPRRPQVRLAFPLPDLDGRYGLLRLAATDDPERPLPNARDVHRYLIRPLQATLQRLCGDVSGRHPRP